MLVEKERIYLKTFLESAYAAARLKSQQIQRHQTIIVEDSVDVCQGFQDEQF